MIVYADREQRVSSRALLHIIESCDNETERLIRYGQLESGVMDELYPAFDGETALSMPDEITIRTPEGFAFYAVYPEQYEAAARRFEMECNPASAVVIGIRSIGTTLSIAVAGALTCPTWRFTVRPHGHPFDRQVIFAPALSKRIRQRAGDWFLIVDEGPGKSGSSFASVAAALNQAGIDDDRIVFFPSHDPSPTSFVNKGAAERWSRHRKYWEPFDRNASIPHSARDLSGGKWRELLFPNKANYPDVVPENERRKYLDGRTLWKFAGLGHFGEEKLARAELLRDFVPPVIGFENGFLQQEWVEGTAVQEADAALANFVERYIQRLKEAFPPRGPTRYAELRHMILINTGVIVPERLPQVEDEPVIEVDGRMLAHEWIRTANGYLKTDALDHHNDHFFPGTQPISWDKAGAAVELGLNVKVDRFWKIAYLAYRIGYTDMFGQAALQARYTAALDRVASGLPRSSIT